MRQRGTGAGQTRRWGWLVPVAMVVGGLVAVQPGANAAPTVTTFAAVADGGVDANQPRSTYAAGELPAGAWPQRSSYLRFSVTGLGARPTRAVLRMHVMDRSSASSPSGGSVVQVAATGWAERSLTWNSRPATIATVATAGKASRNAWVEFDVTSLVTGNSTVDLGIVSSNLDQVTYDSRDSRSRGPQLVVTSDPAVTTTTTAPTTTTTAAPTTTTTAPPAGTQVVTLAPVADTTVDAAAPGNAFGAAPRLQVRAGPDQVSYLRFDLRSLPGRVTAASLRLHVGSDAEAGSATGGVVKVVSDQTWTETGTTWANRPALDGATVWGLGAVGAGQWVTMDVGWATRAGSTWSVGVATTNTDQVTYDSRETGATAPQLVVTVEVTTPPTSALLWAAGDIARCESTGDEATAALLDGTTGTIAPLGDLAYPDGTAAQFRDCFGPSWGRHVARMRPVVGNHEYNTAGAGPYWDYFGAAAGTRGQGWYSYDLGSWHIVALNSNCTQVGGCGPGSPQETWLRADLAATTKPCIAAYWHHPLFDSAGAGSPTVKPLFAALQAARVDVVLNGHSHTYERFARQTADGVASASGVRQFTVGVGGAEAYLPVQVAPNSEVRGATFGVLRLTLGAGSYQWQFMPVAGKTFTDSGSDACLS